MGIRDIQDAVDTPDQVFQDGQDIPALEHLVIRVGRGFQDTAAGRASVGGRDFRENQVGLDSLDLV